MKVFSLILVAALAYTASGFGEIGDVLFKKYAMMKIFEDCYGKETVKGLWREVRAACGKCKGHQMDQSMVQDLPMMPENQDFNPQMASQQQIPASYFLKVNPELLRQSFAYQQQIPFYMPYPAQFMGYPMQPNNFYNYRQKRSMEDMKEPMQAPQRSPNPQMLKSLEKIAGLKSKIEAKISNITCIMQELNFLDSKLQPNYEAIRNRINSWPISEDLKKDLCEGIDTCKDFSSCLPEKNFEKMDSIKHLAKPYVFLKCFKTKKLMSCVKKDLREKFGELAAEEGLIMARTIGAQNLENSDVDPEEMSSSIFQNLYGFDMAADVDIF